MGEFPLAVLEAAKQRPPQLDLAECCLGQTNLRAGALHRCRVSEEASVWQALEMCAEETGVAGAHSQLVGIDDRERIERVMLQGPAHAIDGEAVQIAPFDWARRGMDHRAQALKREIGQQVVVATAVVEQDERCRIQRVQIAD